MLLRTGLETAGKSVEARQEEAVPNRSCCQALIQFWAVPCWRFQSRGMVSQVTSRASSQFEDSTWSEGI